MYARLFAKSGKMAGSSFEIVAEAIIGHGPECNLLIKSGILSAKHARIYYDQKKASYFLEDLKSFNGTLLDGKPVTGKVKLEKKHVIIFANMFSFIFQIEHGQAADPLPPPPVDLPPEPEPLPRKKQPELQESGVSVPEMPLPPLPVPEPQAVPAAVEPPPAPVQEAAPRPHTVFDDAPELPQVEEQFIGDIADPSPAAPPPPAPHGRDAAPTMLIDEAQLAELFDPRPRFMLEFKNVRGEKYSIDLKEGENSVGRLSGSDIAVDDASISRNHAVVMIRSGKVTIADLGSKNGTFLNDKKITTETAVEHEAAIRFGLVKAILLRKPENPA